MELSGKRTLSTVKTESHSRGPRVVQPQRPEEEIECPTPLAHLKAPVTQQQQAVTQLLDQSEFKQPLRYFTGSVPQSVSQQQLK